MEPTAIGMPGMAPACGEGGGFLAHTHACVFAADASQRSSVDALQADIVPTLRS